MGELNDGKVRIAEDKDFEHLKKLCDSKDGWSCAYEKKTTCVYTKNTSSNIQMIKVCTTYTDISASVLYDVLHDPQYRQEWDKHMLSTLDVGYLNPNNDISYYAVSCPTPLKNRDFVLQRSWLDTGKEMFVLNHSVYHKDHPPRKGYIRGFSYITGYLLRSVPSGGCTLSYISHTDPKGKLPHWFVNKVIHVFAPKMVKTLHKASLNYLEWKHDHAPLYKPWIYPEQINGARISIEQCTRTKADDVNEDENLNEKQLEKLAETF